jgi:hypothetical protein
LPQFLSLAFLKTLLDWLHFLPDEMARSEIMARFTVLQAGKRRSTMQRQLICRKRRFCILFCADAATIMLANAITIRVFRSFGATKRLKNTLCSFTQG